MHNSKLYVTVLTPHRAISIGDWQNQQLSHAERMATVGLLSAGIAHEINNSTAFISVNPQEWWEFCHQFPLFFSGR